MAAPHVPFARSGGDDAVCFTSGPSGAPFAAGVVHAWLAIDRKPPLVASGISTGAISAAALRRVYQELENARPGTEEQKRWEWYRRYLTAVTDNPIGAIWSAVPDPVDFFATTPPVKDLSVPPELREDSENARRHYFLLTKLGIWLAGLPLRISTIATIVVMYVRRKEGYGFGIAKQWLFYWNLIKAATGVSWHIFRSPTFIWERSFSGSKKHVFFHPLFGTIWLINLLAGMLVLLAVLFLLSSPVLLWQGYIALLEGIPLIALALLIILVGLFNSSSRLGWALPRYLLKRLDLTKALLNPYEVKRQLHDLFVVNAPVVKEGSRPHDVRLLIVCAALEQTKQICLDEDIPIVEALTAAISVPGLFPPVELLGRNIIDGAAVRTNPIPAFFEWCKETSARDLVSRLERDPDEPPSLHVIYNVPIEYSGSIPDATLPCPDIVKSAQLALQLEKRRDTRQEVRQTNYTSKLESIRRQLTREPRGGPDGPFVIFADEIAPKEEINVGSGLAPDPKKLMDTVALGCRNTLESIYRDDLLAFGKGQDVECTEFLAKMAGRRDPHGTGSVGGLPEVCRACSGKLRYTQLLDPELPPAGVLRSYGEPGTAPRVNLATTFGHLKTDSPKVVFLGSGGVFRGAFHIGVIGAMTASELYPDLVVGASVGALMGGALCHITAGAHSNETAVLNELVNLFLNVDSRVALTKTLKNAAKQLGTRARAVKLSPAELSRMVHKGSQADPGYAATGAPPALIDAISSVFMIPHRNTAGIASQFVAGHISQATDRFLSQIRKETLSSFEVKTALMGISLLEGQVRKLLGEGSQGVDLRAFQAYHNPVRKKVSFFCTTSYLNAGISLLLGRDFLSSDPTWDGVFAGLSSSAFPAVFAPRTEADLLPGRGRTDRFFADGGMFDNLPFFPAIELLSAVQRSDNKTSPQTIQTVVKERATHPNLFIAAGLNAPPDPGGIYDTLFKIKDRASSLSVESKTDTFRKGAHKTQASMVQITSQQLDTFSTLSPANLKFLDSSVSASIVSISPTDSKHINPTFAFCRSTGLEKTRVQRSIADGCYQSLAEFAQNPIVNRYLSNASNAITVRGIDPSFKVERTVCPFYEKGGQKLTCPFSQSQQAHISAVWKECFADKATTRKKLRSFWNHLFSHR